MIGDIVVRPHLNPPASTQPRLWFEDLHVGRAFVSRDYEITETEMIAFAGTTTRSRSTRTPWPRGRRSSRGSLRALAHGGRHDALGRRARAARRRHRGRPHRPSLMARPGDRLHVKSGVKSLRPPRSKPDRGLVIFRCTTYDHRDEPVQIPMPKLFVPLRDYATGAPT